MSEVTDLINKWRSITADLRVINEELDTKRKEFNDADAAHAEAVQQWDTQKIAMQQAVAESMRTVEAAEQTAQQKRKEAEGLAAQAAERRDRNAKQMAIIVQQQNALQSRVRQADEADRSARTDLEEFRNAQRASHDHLSKAVAKATEQLSREQQEFARKKEELRQRHAQLLATMESEEIEWQAEVAKRRKQTRAAFRERLTIELNLTTEARSAMHTLKSEMPPAMSTDVLRDLASLKSLLSG
jgi:hypothetical protein